MALLAYFEAGVPTAQAKAYLLTEDEAAPRVAAGELIHKTFEEIFS